MSIKICFAGATGWAGTALARGIAAEGDLTIVSAISRSHAGKRLGDVVGDARLTAPIAGDVRAALRAAPCDVFVEYTAPAVAKDNILVALEHGAHVVVGTSGLTDQDYLEIDAAAKQHQRGVLACGNFALTVVLLQRFAEMAARHIAQWEIVDYASDAKPDAPSGTARELAFRISTVRHPAPTLPVERTVGPPEARGATLNGSQIHSIRLPSYSLSTEIIFGMPDQRLILRHETGSSAEPYVDGALLAIRRVGTLIGVHRGLDAVLDL
jgi:4-hydroxy-tetrahydrodipicolinate reductase